MQASTLRDTAASVGETVADIVHEAGEVAQKLAAKTPWVDEPRPARRMPMWIVPVLVVAALAAVGWWLTSRRKQTTNVGDDRVEQPRDIRGRYAAAGS